jgi:predicted N-formylglutamate amidohydrolase
MDARIDRLLAEDEPSPVAIDRPDGTSPLVLTCDHAARRIPRRLGQLGLAAPDLDRHIAWDIGIEAVSRQVGEALNATLIRQAYSRLVIDCNRPLDAASSIPTISEATEIPGNLRLNAAERQARIDEIFAPYHAAITAALDERAKAGRPTLLVAMHSFTPVYLGESRPWHIGTLYGRDRRLALILYDLLHREPGLVVGDNQPYAASDTTDYAIPVHGERRGLSHVGIEIRQDLIADPAGQAEWAERMTRLLPLAAEALLRSPARAAASGGRPWPGA